MPRQVKQVSTTPAVTDRVALLAPLDRPAQAAAKPAASFDPTESLPRKRDIAKRYAVSLRTVDRWVAEKKIPYLNLDKRTIRFRWPDVERAVNRLAVREVA